MQLFKKISDFNQRIIFLFLAIFIYRLGAHIPVPNINMELLSVYMSQTENMLIHTMNIFSGGAIKKMSVLMLGITPYITSSIIIQLLTLFVGKFKRIKKEGIKGQIILNKYIKRLTILMVIAQSTTIINYIASQNINGQSLLNTNISSFYISAVFSFVVGTLFLVWLSDKITKLGLGSGVSILILAAIIASLPDTINSINLLISSGSLMMIEVLFIIFCLISTFMFVTLFENSYRRIPIVSSKMDKGNKNFIPLKANLTSIMPSIFASMMIVLLLTINGFISNITKFDIILSIKSVIGDYPIYSMIFMVFLIYLISFMYVKTQINPKEMSENLKKTGVFINGIRAGKNTENYLKEKVKLLTFISASYISIVCLIPEILISKFALNFYMGGTTLIIMVSVSKEIYESYKLEKNKSKIELKKEQLKSFYVKR